MSKLSLLFLSTSVLILSIKSPKPGVHDSYDEPFPINKRVIDDSIGYPALARKLNIAGQLIYRIQVSKEGEYVGYELITSPIPILSKRVEQFLPLLRFSPAMADSVPVDSWINLPFNFELFGGGGGPDREFRKGLSEQLKGRDSSAIFHFSNSIERQYHLFQLHSVIQRAICSHRIGDYDNAEADFQWALAKRKKFIRKWRRVEVDLIRDPYILALERQELRELMQTTPEELDSLIQVVYDAFTP